MGTDKARSRLVQRIEDLTGCRVIALTGVGGGSINDTWRVTLDRKPAAATGEPNTAACEVVHDAQNPRDVFVKTHRAPPARFYRAEADGLAWLAEAGTLRVPAVVGVGDDLLVLEWIDTASPASDHDDLLGRGLAALHQQGPVAFGLGDDNFVGSVVQHNTLAEDWPTFYWSHRIEPLARRAIDLGVLPATTTARFERLASRLRDLCGPPEPPARLHGDLWAGNAITDGHGRPVILDPAVYGGHREMDLAMMRLFGGFTNRVFDAYSEVFPLAEGSADRVALYQLYPLLVHVTIFGQGYAGATLHALERYA